VNSNRSSAGPAEIPKTGPAGSAATDHLQRTLRILPHWQLGGSTYFLTYRCLQGMILSSIDRTIVLDNWKYWHAKRYSLHAVVVMPDHAHVLMTPVKKSDDAWFGLNQIIHTSKSFTAHEINKRACRTGYVWQEERFDRIVRNEQEFWEKWNYMASNPVKAGLCAVSDEYPWWYSHLEEATAGPHRLATPPDL
jgi:REP element-mobilizing transposase RayT